MLIFLNLVRISPSCSEAQRGIPPPSEVSPKSSLQGPLLPDQVALLAVPWTNWIHTIAYGFCISWSLFLELSLPQILVCFTSCLFQRQCDHLIYNCTSSLFACHASYLLFLLPDTQYIQHTVHLFIFPFSPVHCKLHNDWNFCLFFQWNLPSTWDSAWHRVINGYLLN